jgi:hypothetical protein
MAFYPEIFFPYVDNKLTISDPFSPLNLLTVNVKLTPLKLTVNASIFARPICGIRKPYPAKYNALLAEEPRQELSSRPK